MDLARASDQIDQLIERRAAGREEATATEQAWKASVRRHNAKLRRQHHAEWFVYFSRLADAHARTSEHFEEKARALLEEPTTNGREA